MKKLVKVVIEKEIEIDIDDSCLTPEALAEFESYMFKFDSPETAVKELFEYAAKCCFDDEPTFIEGLGDANPTYRAKFDPSTKVTFKVVDEEAYTEVL